MQFEPIIESDDDGRSNRIRGIRVTHGEYFNEWSISTIARNDIDVLRAMEELNDYFSLLPKAKQEAIFILYEKIQDCFQGTVDINRVFANVRALVTELYQLLPFDDFRHYVHNRSKVKIPDEIMSAYGQDAPESPLTYLRHEYKDLLAYAMYVKPMFPIWGQYTLQIKDQIGAEFKEYSAIKLLQGSSAIDNDAYRRLHLYVATNVSKTTDSIEAILGGLSSEEKPDWLTAIVIVRRLSSWQPTYVGEPGKVENIIADIYNYMRSKVENMAKNFGGRVKSKPLRARSDSTEEGSSVAEMYKMKEPVSEGDILINEVACDDPRWLASYLDPTVPLTYVDESLLMLQNEGYESLTKCQGTILRYIVNRAIPARVVCQLSYKAMLSILAVSQSLLRHWGLDWLAVYLTSYPIVLPHDRVTGSLRLDLSEDRIHALLELYPHFIPQKNLKRDNVANRVKTNDAINAINTLVGYIDEYGWRYRAPKSLLSELKSRDDQAAPANIRDMLADLIIKTQKR